MRDPIGVSDFSDFFLSALWAAYAMVDVGWKEVGLFADNAKPWDWLSAIIFNLVDEAIVLGGALPTAKYLIL